MKRLGKVRFLLYMWWLRPPFSAPGLLYCSDAHRADPSHSVPDRSLWHAAMSPGMSGKYAIFAEILEGSRITELAWRTTADWAWEHYIYWTEPGIQHSFTNVRHTKGSHEIQRVHEGDQPIKPAHQGDQQYPFSSIWPRRTPRQNGRHKGTIKRLHSNPCETCLTAREHGRYA